ncbi:MAG: hypothetical protein WC679_05815 [Bacteroidales bacterium]|jgi:hypothetical protein
MKRKALLLIVIFALTLTINACKNNNDKIVGKWQHILIVGEHPQGNDTLDMTKYPPTFNIFRDDSTLLVTNGQKEVNVRYYVSNNKLYSFQLGAFDTSKMEIKKLTKDELILQVTLKNDEQSKEKLYYKRVK